MWKSIPGYEGIYEIDEIGNIRSVGQLTRSGFRPRSTPRTVKTYLNMNGYIYAGLMREAVRHVTGVHRLVLLSFVGVPEGRFDAHHKNSIRTDNRLENLEWVSRQNNIKERDLSGGTASGIRHGMFGKGHKVAGTLNGNAKLTDSIVADIRARVSAGETHLSVAKRYGVKEPAVWKIANNRSWNKED